MSNIISYLFETKAVKFCEENKPFWYTSGKIGPYFINTHFVYGDEDSATILLNSINEGLTDRIHLPTNIFKQAWKQYSENKIYKDVIDTMIQEIKKSINIEEIDYVSGGERRDWFFSNVIAHILEKPHISIFKDLSTMVSDYNFEETKAIESLDGKKVLHIADLITVASSYIRAWIPAIRSLGASIQWSCVVVDRVQGVTEKIEQEGIHSISLVKVDTTLFQKAFDLRHYQSKTIGNATRFLPKSR